MITRRLKRLTPLVLVIVVVLSGLGTLRAIPVSAASGGWLSGWTNRIAITIDHNKTSAALSNFPVLVHVSPASGTNGANVSAVFSALGANSRKLAVTTSDGTTQCYVEIERWDSANKQGYLWVKVPAVSSTTDTTLYLYYDNSQADNTTYVGVTGSTPAQNVWDSNFVAVWHMAQSGSGAAGEFKDSTRNRRDAQGGGGLGYGTPTLTTSAPFGVAQSFNGSNNYISVPDSDAFSVTTTNNLTVSAWMSPSAVNQPKSTGGYTRWLGKSTSNNIEWQFVYYDQSYSTRSQWISYYNYSASGGLGAGDYSTGNFSAGSWVYVNGTSTASSSTQGIPRVYRGAAVSSGYPDTWQKYGLTYSNTGSPVTIGTGWLGSGNWWSGKLGEIRISNTTRSNAWVAASYYAESDALAAYGSPQTNGSTGTAPAPTPPVSGSNALYDNYRASADSTSIGLHSAQTFTPQTTYTIKSVKLNLINAGAAGSVTVSIRAVDGNGVPTGGNLVTSTAVSNSTIPAAWTVVTFNLGSGYQLKAGTKYALQVNSTSSGLYNRVDTAGSYARGMYFSANDAQTYWNNHSGIWDIWFEDWGTP